MSRYQKERKRFLGKVTVEAGTDESEKSEHTY